MAAAATTACKEAPCALASEVPEAERRSAKAVAWASGEALLCALTLALLAAAASLVVAEPGSSKAAAVTSEEVLGAFVPALLATVKRRGSTSAGGSEAARASAVGC